VHISKPKTHVYCWGGNDGSHIKLSAIYSGTCFSYTLLDFWQNSNRLVNQHKRIEPVFEGGFPNVADRVAVQTWVAIVVEKNGRVDVLVNNAGILRDGLFITVKDGVIVVVR
jgi:hypothetical protein